MRYLEKVRIPEQHYSKTKEALYTVGVLALGIMVQLSRQKSEIFIMN